MRLRLFATLAVLAAAPVLARATPITYDVSFTATGAVPASASFTLTFDPASYVVNSSSNFKVNSFNPASLGLVPAGFSYDPDLAGGTLNIGGLLGTTLLALPFTNDYIFDVTNFRSVPTFLVFYRTTSGSLLPQVDFTGSVKVNAIAAAVTPEPSSLLMLGTGALGMLAAFRRRLV